MSFLREFATQCGSAVLSEDLPFSFTYGDESSRAFIESWDKRTDVHSPDGRRNVEVTTYAEPDGGLEVRVEITRFVDFPAVEWVMSFRNSGTKDTPIIENVMPLDLKLTAPAGGIVLHHSHGSTCEPTDFLPIDEPLAPRGQVEMAPGGGRSSDGALPFFNLEYSTGGIVGAIGWSGQWRLRASRDEETGLGLEAGQQILRARLDPGERIRTPRILLVGWSGEDPMLGHNLFRRLLLAHYVPRVDGEIAIPPVTANTWFTFNQGNDVTEENQLAQMHGYVRAGIEYYWLDAGWFEGGWPAGAGSWVPKKEAFPNGLRTVGDAAHRQGLKFVLWFEPERVNSNSKIAAEHPEWVLHFSDENSNGLFDLGNPDARRWLTDYLAKCLIDWDVDVFRNDFNIGPLAYWTAADEPDQAGITENRYVEGLYAMWDELRLRKPGLTIDNCASGGRRIDIETTSRSYPLWQSDTQCCGHDQAVQNQVQNAGLSLYVPNHTAGGWCFDAYNIRSVATNGCSICTDLSGNDELIEMARKATDEVRALRPYYLGDYYPLLPISLDPSAWCGWQYHRGDLDAGFAMLFRREKSAYSRAEISLRGLDAGRQYMVTDVDSACTQALSGSELAAGIAIDLTKPAGTKLLRYSAVASEGKLK